MQSKAEDAATIAPGMLAGGDWLYLFTQIGAWGHVPESVINIAQLAMMYSLASQLRESVRGPILDVLRDGIHQQAQSLA